MKYPKVLGEFETIRKVMAGHSLARFGDGELKMANGFGYTRQFGSPQLAAELMHILKHPGDHGCLVGIPTMDERGPKYPSWIRHEQRFIDSLADHGQYVSAFVSRPDSAPWIESAEYVELVERIWKNQRVVVLCEKGGSMMRAVKITSKNAIHVRCPTHQAYDIIDDLERQILKHKPQVVVLSCGPTATCLAHRLAVRGVHAVDLGSAGQFFMRARRKA